MGLGSWWRRQSAHEPVLRSSLQRPCQLADLIQGTAVFRRLSVGNFKGEQILERGRDGFSGSKIAQKLNRQALFAEVLGSFFVQRTHA